MNDFLQSTGLSPVVAASAMLALWGFLLYAARSVPKHLWAYLLRRFTLTVEIHSTDNAFFWLERWLAEHPYAGTATSVRVVASPRAMMAGLPEAKATTPQAHHVRMSLAGGAHLFRHHGRWLLLKRDERNISSGQGAGGMPSEMFTIRSFSRDQTPIRRLLEEARDLANPPNEPRIGVFLGMDSWWHRIMELPQREPASIVLRRDQLDDLLADVHEFVGSRAWYRTRGVPYRRGYLLQGPPGSGKTTLVHVIASVLGWDLYVLPLSSLNDSQVQRLMASVPERSVLLLEDVDCAGLGRRALESGAAPGPAEGAQKGGVTLSGLLNTLDGVIATEGRLLFLTTNAPDALDAALKRPGRADRVVDLTLADYDMAFRLFRQFFPDARGRDTLANRFATAGAGQSMATLQGHLLRFRASPQQAVDALGASAP